MNFKQATDEQLFTIISKYETCPLTYKQYALNEIQRRKKKHYRRTQYRQKDKANMA